MGVFFARDIPWVVAFTDSTTASLHQMYEVFFDRGILNVVSVDADANIYTYFPFEQNQCYNFQPVLIAKVGTRDFHRINLFPKTKTKNLYNCSIEILLFPIAPDIRLPSEQPSLSRRLEEVIGIISKKVMKFHPVFTYPSTRLEGIQSVLANPRRLTLGLPVIVNQVHHASSLIYRCITWCVPVNFNNRPNLNPLTNSFGLDLWTACAITVCGVMGVSRFLFSRHKDHSSLWMFILSIVVQIPTPVYYLENKTRVFVISLYMAFLVINTVFKARLHLLMAYSSPPSRLADATQVYKSTLNLFRLYTTDTILEDSIENSGVSVSPNRIFRFEHTNADSVARLYAALKNGSAAVLANTDFCRDIITKFGKTDAGYYKVYHQRLCVANLPVPYFGFSNNSPFASRLEQVNRLLREHGLHKLMLSPPLSEQSPSLIPLPIRVDDIHIVIVLWLAGLSISAIVLVGEFFARIAEKDARR